MKLYINNKEVEVEIEHSRRGCEDSYISSGSYIDTDVELTEVELERLNDFYRDEIEEDWINYMVSQADFYEIS